MELKEGVVARIVKDPYPENIGKRVLLRHQPDIDLVTKEELKKGTGWLAWPIDDVVAKPLPNSRVRGILFKGLQKTFLFHLIVKDDEIKAYPKDNEGTETFTFTEHPLRSLLEVRPVDETSN